MDALNHRQRVIKAMTSASDEEFNALLVGIHAADLAEIIEDLELHEGRSIVERLSHSNAADVLVELDEELRRELLSTYTSDEIASEIVGNMESDDAADLLSELPEALTREVLSKVGDVEQAKQIAQLLTHEENTAGALMATELVKVNHTTSALRCVAEMRRQAEKVERVHAIYVVDENDILLGTLSLKKLLTVDNRANIADIYSPIEHTVLSNTPS